MGNCVGLGTTKQSVKLITMRELRWQCMLTRRGCTHCERREKEWTCPDVGSCSCPQNALALPSCVFYSPRIQGLFEGERTELETTQEHWTQVGLGDDVEMERVGEENRKYFDEVLVKNRYYRGFFSRFEGLIVEEKIGKGGQGEIFGARMKYGKFRGESLVAKVFKKDMSLRDLERQWPIALLGKKGEISFPLLPMNPIHNVLGGAFIRDGIHKNRFAFVMIRRMCDLRALIDKRMLNLLHMRTHGPPFQDMGMVTMLLYNISVNMCKLHEHGVVHRDIKASNVLLDGLTVHYLMDFECALGAMGTGFWRAPEILEQVQRRVPTREVVFTEKADIYSFGMLCYEVVTGCIPFDGHPQNDYNIVYGGRRPELPCNPDPILKKLILMCWNQNPQDRPTARVIETIMRIRAMALRNTLFFF